VVAWLGLVSALLAAAPASATVLPPTTNPLPGSMFQGADGNQDDAAPLLDWQALQTAGRVVHSPDPNAQDSAFTGGSTEEKPGEWGLTTEPGGVKPAKANIRDAWSAVSHPSGHTFLYLGFTREEEGGTTFLAFELNHDERLWDNGNARIPCRRTGDVLVSYEPQGNRVNVLLQRWVTLSTDPATGCAMTGRLDEFTGLDPNMDAQGAINANAIMSRLPGAYSGTVPRERFGETALNLASLLEEAFRDDCLSFRSFWMHSRSSNSESSNMQDYVAPQPLDVRTCSASGTKFFDRNANGVRDPDDPGIPRFMIFADYDDDGQLDPLEPRTITDDQGRYVLHDIRPPDGTYRLRETLLPGRSRRRAAALDWTCSFPNDGTPGGSGSATGGLFPCAWGPLDVNLSPDVRGRDFGNWFPVQPPTPPQPPDGPDGGGPAEPAAPPGPTPPKAGAAGVARFLFRQATRRCIRERVPHVDFSGSRIRSIRVFVNGSLRRNLTVRTLQRRVTPRVTFPPGRYRVTVRVQFQRGAGTPPLTLSRMIRICGAAAPPVTG
jgi:hypothetical protein